MNAVKFLDEANNCNNGIREVLLVGSSLGRAAEIVEKVVQLDRKALDEGYLEGRYAISVKSEDMLVRFEVGESWDAVADGVDEWNNL